LERRLPAGAVSTKDVDGAFAILGDRRALAELLDARDAAQLEGLFARLEAFEGDFSPEHVEAAIGALLDQLGRLREGREQMFDLGADVSLSRVVLRLLRRVESIEDREALIGRLLPTLRWLSARRSLIRIAKGHDLAGDDAAATWTVALHEAVAGRAPSKLLGERDAGFLVVDAIKAGAPWAGGALALLADDVAFVQFLASLMSEQFSGRMGDVTSRRERRLPWKALAGLLGESWLRERVDAAAAAVDRADLPDRTGHALELAVRYASGWVPPDMFGDTPTVAESAAPADTDATVDPGR
jgi:hypothetical protein